MTNHRDIDLRAQPMTLDEARALMGAEPVGFKAITEAGPICHDGCLAPGSSAHSHSTVTGYMIIGPTSILTINTDGMAVRDSMLHPFHN